MLLHEIFYNSIWIIMNNHRIKYQEKLSMSQFTTAYLEGDGFRGDYLKYNNMMEKYVFGIFL